MSYFHVYLLLRKQLNRMYTQLKVGQILTFMTIVISIYIFLVKTYENDFGKCEMSRKIQQHRNYPSSSVRSTKVKISSMSKIVYCRHRLKMLHDCVPRGDQDFEGSCFISEFRVTAIQAFFFTFSINHVYI